MPSAGTGCMSGLLMAKKPLRGEEALLFRRMATMVDGLASLISFKEGTRVLFKHVMWSFVQWT